jgi:pimeloyl-ACP methyl ester carboxylesterase
MLQKTAIAAAFLVPMLAWLVSTAPGEPEWIYDPPSTKADQVRFLGGDGSTWLTGEFHRPIMSTGPDVDVDVDVEDPPKTPSPIIVLAHGLGLSQDCHLEPFVEAFTSAGFAAFTFDYATFGASDGLPRHQVHPRKQITDFQAAITMLKQNAKELNLDTTKLGIWGISLGGGHSLMVASQDPSIRAVAALVPHVGSAAETVVGTLMTNPRLMLPGLLQVMHGTLKWAIMGLVYGKPWYLPLHGPPGSAAMMQNPGDDEGYASLLPAKSDYGWRNAATAGSGLNILAYRPMDSISKISSPTLLMAAEQDTLSPAKEVVKAAKLIQIADLLVFPGAGHFDVFHDERLEQVLARTIEFYQKHLN